MRKGKYQQAEAEEQLQFKQRMQPVHKRIRRPVAEAGQKRSETGVSKPSGTFSFTERPLPVWMLTAIGDLSGLLTAYFYSGWTGLNERSPFGGLHYHTSDPVRKG